MKFFLDAYALIEIAKGNKDYFKYYESDIVTLKPNLAELFYILFRENEEQTAKIFFDIFSRIAVGIPLDHIPKAMIFRYNNRKRGFSYIDCFGYIYALESGRVFLTGDRAFKGMKNVEIIR